MKRIVTLTVLLLAGWTLAADWPQFRGPSRDGIAPQSPALATSWPKSGPKLLWKSTSLPSQWGSGVRSGGCGSVAVADGKAFVYHSWKHDTPIPQRKFTTSALNGMGWMAGLPDDLATKIEDARLSAVSSGLKGKDLTNFTKQFVQNTFAPASAPASQPSPQMKKFSNYANNRLASGARAIAWGDLAKLSAIGDKEFATPEEFDKALAEMNLSDAAKKAVLAAVPTVTSAFTDNFLCFDAATGQPIWNTEFPGVGYDYAASSTPTVCGDRVYVAGSDGKVYCLSVKDGAKIWQGATKASPKTRVSSSFLLVGKAAILLGGQLTAYDADTGEILWTQPKVKAEENSAVAWTCGDKQYIICNGPNTIACVDPENGNVLWDAADKSYQGQYTTPTVSGDMMLIFSRSGLTAYKLTSEKAKQVWNKKEWRDRGASVVVDQGYVYVVAGRIACLELASGNVKWEAKAGGEICSPALADGKIICGVDGGDSTIYFRANPEKYELLGKAKLTQAVCSSAAIVDGKMYLRLDNAVACYDLTPEK